MNILSIENLEKRCTGCLSCLDSCPTGCIQINEDLLFTYPQIDEDKCISCGKCNNVCPIINIKKYESNNQHLYIAYSLDEEKVNASASGGLFRVLAEHWLTQGGYVCGATFDENLKLSHQLINGTDDLFPMLKSKYLQSNMVGIYNQILTLLKNNEKVLFSGTPCQVSALKNFIPSKYHVNLVTIDLICHGVPSQKIFDLYIKELEAKHKGQVVDFKFRVKNKERCVSHYFSYSIYKNGKTLTYKGSCWDSTYYTAFKKYLIFRESCYNCNYTTLNRVSDITLADFWGIEKYKPDLNAHKGISMVITNTKNGKYLYEQIINQIYSEECPIEWGINSNHCLTHKTNYPSNYNEIINSLEKNGYSITAKKYFSSGLLRKIYHHCPIFVYRIVKKLKKML